jgi:DegV family protein with EDD domain
LALKVAIVTDSTADLPPELVEELGVTIVPLQVIFGDEAYREGVDITTEEFYERLVKSRQLPTTSAPSVGDFQEVYGRLLEEVDSIVSIHISGKLSPGTVQAAQTARQSLARPERIELVDSQATSMAMGFAIIEAVEASRAGAKLGEVKAAAEGAVQRIHVLFMLDTLEYLRRGGRIGRARAYLGALLRVKPILTLREGEVYPEERVRTRARGLERIIQSGIRHQNVKLAAVAHSTTPDEAESIRERVAMAFPNVKVHLVRFGPVLGTHAGPGIVGVGVMEGE